MWQLKLSGGVEISERQMRNWDQVPRDVEIDRAALIFQRPGTVPFVIEMSGYERYCIARSVSTGFARAGGGQGYALYGAKLALVTELEVLPSGMRMKMYSLEQCQLPERCWRNGHV
jgi:hypothetical protein